MANAYVRESGVQDNGDGTWSVVINRKVVESGIGNRDAAVAACLWWQVNYRVEGAARKDLPAEFFDDQLGQGRR